MRKPLFQCLLASLTLAASSAYAQQQRPPSDVHPQSGDDAPIIIGDTSAFPLEDFIQVTGPKTGPCPITNTRYRFLYARYFKHMDGAPDQINDESGAHRVTVLFACSRDPANCMYKPDSYLDFSGEDRDAIHIWDGSLIHRHFRLTWDDAKKITIEPNGRAKPSSDSRWSLDLLDPLREVRDTSDAPYRRPDDKNDYRYVLHYCSQGANCTLAYLRDNDPCASGLPSKDNPPESVKPKD